MELQGIDKRLVFCYNRVTFRSDRLLIRQGFCGSGICGIAVISAIYGQKNIYEATASLKKVTEEMVRA